MLGGKRLEFVEEPSNGDSSLAGLDNYIRTTLKLAGYTHIHTYIHTYIHYQIRYKCTNSLPKSKVHNNLYMYH